MKWLKRIGIGFGVVVLLLVVVTFLLPGDWEVTRSREMKATRAEIHAYTADWSKWPLWNTFETGDPKMKIVVDGAPTGVGASRSWADSEMGPGSMTFKAVDPEKGVTFALVMGEMKLTGNLSYGPGSSQDTTLVTWHDHGTNSGSMKWFGLMADSMLGAEFEKSLANLESAIVEKK